MNFYLYVCLQILCYSNSNSSLLLAIQELLEESYWNNYKFLELLVNELIKIFLEKKYVALAQINGTLKVQRILNHLE